MGWQRGNAYFDEPKAHKKVGGLPAYRTGKLINMRYEKDEPHDINEVALHVTLQCETL
jgi:hypothetical protein